MLKSFEMKKFIMFVVFHHLDDSLAKIMTSTSIRNTTFLHDSRGRECEEREPTLQA
jgi:hypothetical protein